MIQTVITGQSLVFLFTDSQIVQEGFVEDLNNLLNSGEIPNLFPSDEMERMVQEMRPIVKSMGLIDTEQCINVYIERVRHYLHFVLAMSPVGSALRIRCRAFPSLIHCCTIDWYMNWPKEALESVADRFLTRITFPTSDIHTALISMSSFVHTSANEYGNQFAIQLQRYVYTTPKSF